MSDETTKKCLWVFGNAVQDITVEVDIERLSREVDAKRALIHLADQGPQVSRRLSLTTQIGSREFGVRVELENVTETEEEMYLLEGGQKYTLKGRVLDSWQELEEPSLFLPCENLSWGGGGTNVVTFLRALVPSSEVVPLRYTDIAMSRSLPNVIQQALDVLGPLADELSGSLGDGSLVSFLEGLFENDRVRAELLTRNIAAIAAGYSPELAFAVYLASLSVESVLYRPRLLQFRRNWVFSRFRSAYREMNNKIILKSSFTPLADDEQGKIDNLLQAHTANVGAILINSLKDPPLFKAAYSLCKSSCEEKDFVAIMAMTETTQEFTKWMLDHPHKDGCLPPFILVLNEKEAYKLAMAFKGDNEPPLEPFVTENDFPDIRKFAAIADALRGRFYKWRMPRIYVTLGERGSLGVDIGSTVIYVASFTKRGATVYDTNACGDAYCATIALLEWAKRNGFPEVAGIKRSETDAEEMRYFMQVATAAAYCKATNRRGRVYAAELKDLLQYNHLASKILGTVGELGSLRMYGVRPDCIDENFRLREPAVAQYVGITKQLSQLIR